MKTKPFLTKSNQNHPNQNKRNQTISSDQEYVISLNPCLKMVEETPAGKKPSGEKPVGKSPSGEKTLRRNDLRRKDRWRKDRVPTLD